MASRSTTSLPGYAEMPPGLVGVSYTPPPVPTIPAAYAYPPSQQQQPYSQPNTTIPPRPTLAPRPGSTAPGTNPYASPYAYPTSRPSFNLNDSNPNISTTDFREAPLHRPQLPYSSYSASPSSRHGRDPSVPAAAGPELRYGTSSLPDTDDGGPINMAGRGTSAIGGYGPVSR